MDLRPLHIVRVTYAHRRGLVANVRSRRSAEKDCRRREVPGLRNSEKNCRAKKAEAMTPSCCRRHLIEKRLLEMKIRHVTLCLGISLVLLASLPAQTFPSANKTINENKNYTIRGVINIVYLPVPDAFELPEPVQSGYFLFTPQRFTVNGTDVEGKRVQFKDQQMFHLALSEDQVAKFTPALGKPVEVEAQPFIGHTRHHRTPVLFNILSLKILEAPKPRR